MPNHQYTSLLCLGALLAHSSGVGVRTLSRLNNFCQIRRSQTTDASSADCAGLVLQLFKNKIDLPVMAGPGYMQINRVGV